MHLVNFGEKVGLVDLVEKVGLVGGWLNGIQFTVTANEKIYEQKNKEKDRLKKAIKEKEKCSLDRKLVN